MSQVDWSKAPKWATKYGESVLAFLPIWLDDTHYCYANESQIFELGAPGSRDSGDIRVIANRLATWSGDGLPPVGTVCEYQRNDVAYKQVWVAVTPLYLGDSIAVLRHEASGDEFTEMTSSCVFRPLRTAEQIAAEDRELAIEEIVQALDCLCLRKPVAAAEAIYAAGYRKQVAP